ncbi:MAG: histidinol dehydrogenase [Bacteroidales bacterium]|nr:histidinol dehydrogenase [Bacteroidales bacterium]
MKILINPERKDWPEINKRTVFENEELSAICKEVFHSITKSGDKALLEYTKKYDNVDIEQLIVSDKEIKEASEQVSEKLKEAIKLAKDNIWKFHQQQEFKTVKVETTLGVECWQESRPIEKIGIYIPGGTAPLFSTVLMLAIPAKIAGCREIVLCTPPNKKGQIANEILYVADLCGVSKIIRLGGIQAVAAMTIGTESVPAVNKIFGPGNQYVTAAKQYATTLGVAIDLPAGPSEVLIMADQSSVPEFIASDLLSQAEHGIDSQVILCSTSQTLLKDVNRIVYRQLENLPRKEIASRAIQESKLVCLPNKETCVDFINQYAPEHYILAVSDTDFFLNGLMNAGSVFIGNYTPESAGDYASGTNHTLPTNGFAKAYSGVNLDSFVKKITFQKVTEEGLKNIGPSIELMAEAEGLQAHKNAVSIRLKLLKS